MASARSTARSVEELPFFITNEKPLPEAPLAAGPPPLFDAGSFSDWMTEVFKENENDVLDKLSRVGKDDDMKKMVRHETIPAPASPQRQMPVRAPMP
jgi:hypothetical protein